MDGQPQRLRLLPFLLLASAVVSAVGRAPQADRPAYEIAINGVSRMRPDGLQVRPVAQAMGMLLPGSWSPDGNRIPERSASGPDSRRALPGLPTPDRSSSYPM